MAYIEWNFEKPIGSKIEPPINSTALCLYLLLEAGIKGIDNYDAVVKGRNWKFNTRISELINKHNLNVHKKDESGKNQFGHTYTSKRYCLYECDMQQNLELYQKINKNH
jgi:hypothetical protein